MRAHSKNIPFARQSLLDEHRWISTALLAGPLLLASPSASADGGRLPPEVEGDWSAEKDQSDEARRLAEAQATSAAGLERRRKWGQRHFGLLFGIGSFSGFAGGIQAGAEQAGIRVVAGWEPVILSVQDPARGQSSLKFFSSFLVSPDFYVGFASLPKGWIGGQLGYRRSSLLGNGFVLGGYGSFYLDRGLDGLLQGGVLIFPNGKDELLSHKRNELPEDADFPIPGAALNFGVSLALAVFP